MRLTLECIQFQMMFSMILLRVINSWSRNILDVFCLFFSHKGKRQKAVEVVCVWWKVKLHCVEETLCGVLGRASVTESAGPAGDSVNTGMSKVLRGKECGFAVDVLLFVHPVHVLGNQTLHDGSFWLQDLEVGTEADDALHVCTVVT